MLPKLELSKPQEARMSDVKRYDPVGADHGAAWMEPESDGDYVSYDDYAALKARLDAAQADRDEWRDLSVSYQTQKSDAKAEITRLTAALATARRDAWEEAAEVCQKISNTDLVAANPPYEEGYSDAADTCFHAIRALIAQEDAAQDRGAEE
jgi:hypothetical protein